VAALLAFDREATIIAALIALGAAGLIVSIGAWILLAQRNRTSRDDE
jgi:hypothetical protein